MNAHGVSLNDSCSPDRQIWNKIWISGNQADLELNKECVCVVGEVPEAAQDPGELVGNRDVRNLRPSS